MSKTPSYIQQISTLNPQSPMIPQEMQGQAQLSSIITDLTNLIKKVNIHERQISTLVSGTT